MQITAASKVGPYEIIAPLGAGGRGEVYRARDTRVDRTVAIKVLPDALAADPHFHERFNREAFSANLVQAGLAIARQQDVVSPDGQRFLANTIEQPPARLEELILQLLDKDREMRCQTAAEARADLRRLKAQLPSVRSSSLSSAMPESGPAAPPSVVSSTSDSQIVLGLVRLTERRSRSQPCFSLRPSSGSDRSPDARRRADARRIAPSPLCRSSR